MEIDKGNDHFTYMYVADKEGPIHKVMQDSRSGVGGDLHASCCVRGKGEVVAVYMMIGSTTEVGHCV